MKFLTAVALALVMLWVPVDGVAQDRNPLKGVTSVDPRVIVTWDDRITFKTESQFLRGSEDALELGLLRAGLRVDSSAPNFVTCWVVLLSRDGNTVSYAWRVAFEELVTIQGQRHFADTWSTMGVVTVGVGNLEGDGLGEDCAEAFELRWRRDNN